MAIDPKQTVELINTSSESANLSGWFIDDNGGSSYYVIPDNTLIYPQSCAVFQGDFNLNKSSADMVRLFNSSAQPTSSSAILIDSFSYKTSPGSGMSFFRSPDANGDWTSGVSNFGMFNTSGLSCFITPTETIPPSPTPNPSPSSPEISITPAPASFQQIYISEVMTAPAPDNPEWVELYNDNDFNVTLTDWFIDDAENTGSSPKKFTLFIPKKSFASVTLTSSMFNNAGDEVRLLDATKSEHDGFEYLNSQTGMTWGRIGLDSDTFCIQYPSENKDNSGCIAPSLGISSSPIKTATIIPLKTTNKPVSIIKGNTTETTLIQNTHQSPSFPTPAILGISTNTNSTDRSLRKSLAASLSFSSGGFSFLTIIAVLRRMKT